MRLTCLVDNCVALGSALWGEHGLSFLIQTEDGNVLWDTGNSGTVLLHNLHQLELDTLPLAAVALSHAHYDHTGGLAEVLARHPRLTVYAHEAIFGERYARRDDAITAIGLASRREELVSKGTFALHRTPQEILPDVRSTGGIAPRPYPPGASRHHLMAQEGALVPDGYLDDMSLVLQVHGGIVLLCGCCHAGLRNTLAVVRRQYDEPLVAILGGTHLARATEAELAALSETLRTEGCPKLYLNHCTGERALRVLWKAFGERVMPCPAGTTIEF